MKSVVLLGGEGTRLRPLTYDLPKPMVPICGKPFTEYQIELMKRYGIDEVIFSLCYKWNAFEEYFGDGSRFGVKIRYVVEESPLGTAGAIKNVESFLDDEPFFVFNGDILSDFNLGEIFEFHKDRGSICTIALTPVDNPTIYGVVEKEKDGRITRFTEKPRPEEIRSNMINAGLYVLDKKVLSRMPAGVKISIEREIFPDLLKDGEPMYGYDYYGYWMDIGNPSKYLSANHDVLEGKLNVNIGLLDGIYMAPDVEIGLNVKLKKPLWIGKGVKIEAGCEIVGPAVIGNGCHIGRDTHIVGALLWDNTKIGDRCNLEYCLIGRNCNIGNDVDVGKLAVIGSNNLIDGGRRIKSESRI